MRGIFCETITKEDLKHCNFGTPTYRFSDFEIRERNQSLYLAMLLGNNFSSNARIIFYTFEGYKELLTTVWATTEKFILLQGGNVIPLESIAAVDLEQ